MLILRTRARGASAGPFEAELEALLSRKVDMSCRTDATAPIMRKKIYTLGQVFAGIDFTLL